MFLDKFKSVLLFSLAASQLSEAATQDYTANAESSYTTLQKWYNSNSGLYNTTGWWNSANVITMIGDLAAVDANLKPKILPILSNSYTQAQKTNLQQIKIITQDFNIQTLSGSDLILNNLAIQATNPKGFLNGYYDDEGWWALAWIQAFDQTGNQDYLSTAIDIFNDMKNGSSPICGGGIWWDKANTYVNAIANELYLSVAAHLANRVPNQKSFYVSVATDQWTWFQKSGMINAKNNINDGLDSKSCKNNNGTVWSYNQGVILGALVELNKAAPSSSYLSTAKSIASAAINSLGSSGVLHDPCEPNCGADGSQFKGIFMRNLQLLQEAAPDNQFLSFIGTNAGSIWEQNRNSAGELGIDWDGPVVAVNAGTHSSAMDALVAAVRFGGQLNGIA